MKVCEALKLAKSEFGTALAWEMLQFSQNKNREELFLSLDKPLENQEAFNEVFTRYKRGEPLEYITRKAEFFTREFFVESGVLIPRVETEILVQKCLQIKFDFDNFRPVTRRFQHPLKIAEIGIGSGVISLTLALEFAKMGVKCDIYATDISPKALQVASKNALKLGFTQSEQGLFEFENLAALRLKQGEFYAQNDEIFDLSVSNPPYIQEGYPIDLWVKSEPKEALFGGVKGDEVLKQIILLAKKNSKFLAVEMGYDQKQSLVKECETHGFAAEFFDDLAGLNRGFVARNLNL